MKKQLLIGAGILLVAIVVAFALISSRSAPPQRPAEAQTPLVQTVPAELRRGALPVDGAGTVRPRAEVALAAEVSGKVVYVNASLVSGSYVRRGEVLVRIDSSDYHNAVAQARADVAQQQVSVIEAEEETVLARAEYAQFRAREQRRVARPYASVDAGDYAARLLPPGALEEGREEADTSGAEPSRLVFREPQLRAAEAARDRAQAQLADAEQALSRTVVVAPFSGYVRSKSVALGSYVSPGQAFAQLVATDVLEVSTPLTRDEAALIPDLWAGQGAGRIPAAVTADYGGFRYRWEGYVDRAEAVLDPETRTINVVVRVPEPITGGRVVTGADAAGREGLEFLSARPPPLLVGEFVQVEIEGARLERYFIIPRRALRSGSTVWVVREGGLQIIPVQVLQEVEMSAYVYTDALDAGEPVVVSDLRVATPGMQVRRADASTTTASPAGR